MATVTVAASAAGAVITAATIVRTARSTNALRCPMLNAYGFEAVGDFLGDRDSERGRPSRSLPVGEVVRPGAELVVPRFGRVERHRALRRRRPVTRPRRRSRAFDLHIEGTVRGCGDGGRPPQLPAVGR